MVLPSSRKDQIFPPFVHLFARDPHSPPLINSQDITSAQNRFFPALLIIFSGLPPFLFPLPIPLLSFFFRSRCFFSTQRVPVEPFLCRVIPPFLKRVNLSGSVFFPLPVKLGPLPGLLCLFGLPRIADRSTSFHNA